MKYRRAFLAVAIVASALAAAYFSETCRILLFGWIAFLHRTIPRATVNVSGVISGGVMLAFLVAAVHYFGRWLVRAVTVEPGAARGSGGSAGASFWLLPSFSCSLSVTPRLGWQDISGGCCLRNEFTLHACSGPIGRIPMQIPKSRKGIILTPLATTLTSTATQTAFPTAQPYSKTRQAAA